MTSESYVTEESLANQFSNYAQEQRAWTVKVMEAAVQSMIDLNDRQDQLYEQFEKQLASLTSAYVEMAAMLESLVSSFVNRSEEDREEFFTNLRQSRKSMIDVLKHAGDQAVKDADKFVAHNPDTPEQPENNSVSGE